MKPKKWEDEARAKIFNILAFIGKDGQDYLDDTVFPFIRKKLDQARKEEREKVMKIVESRRDEFKKTVNGYTFLDSLERVEMKKGKTGYHHIFKHTGGGCGVGELGKGFCCDDEYECVICGKKIKFLSKPEGHFEMPTVFYGKEDCEV